MPKHKLAKWRKNATIEQTPEATIYRFPDGTEIRETNLNFFMSSAEPPKKQAYSQDWKAYDTAQCNEMPLFMKLLADLCSGVGNPIHDFGRPKLPYSDMIFASALKVYSTFSLRRFSSFMKEATKAGYMEQPCSYTSVSNTMRMVELTPILNKLIELSSMPLAAVDIEREFAVDSSGFSTSRFARYFSYKHGRNMEHKEWIKIHLCCGVKTKIVTSVSVTEDHRNDSPELKPLVESTAERFKVEGVMADKAYSSRSNLQLVEEVGGQAFIPFRNNSRALAKGSPAWKKMFHYFMYRREEFMQHYHKRSNVETVFHMIKSKFKDNVRSKDRTAQFNEVLLKVICHNICVLIQEMHELGIDPKFVTEQQLSK